MTREFGRLAILAALLSALGAAYAQSSQSQQNQNNQQAQSAQSSQSQNDQATGVSNPPPDSTIQANEMPPSDSPAPKPSPAIPATPKNSSAAAQTPANATAANSAAPAANGGAQAVDPGDDIVSGPAPATTAGNAANNAGTSNDNNPDDYGIVTSAPPAGAGTTEPGGWDANNAIVNTVPVDPDALGEGTNITVRLKQDLSTSGTQTGATFSADVAQNVYNGSQLVIPAGAEMRGRVVHISQGHRLVSRAMIMLRPDMIVLPDGTAYHLYAVPVESFAKGTDVNEEGGIVASHHYKKDAVEYGAGAGTGAAAGAVVAGPVGAGVGSLVGTGLVGTHMLTQPPESADLPQGSLLVFSLTEPMPLTPTKN